MAFGNVIIGHVLDCNRAPIELALKRYDSELYIKWNPLKKDGIGCWEVRRRPTLLRTEFQGHFEDGELHVLDRFENDFVHHILDVDRLDWRLPETIKAMDTWVHKDWASHIDYEGERWLEREDKKIREDMKYNIRQYSREFKDFAELVAQGMNPGRVLSGFTPKGFQSQENE